jgi:hypothetical protein
MEISFQSIVQVYEVDSPVKDCLTYEMSCAVAGDRLGMSFKVLI